MARRSTLARGDAGDGAVSDMLRRSLKAALARWALHKRRSRRPSVAPSAADEATHATDGRKRFAEDYTFVGVQPRSAVLVRLEWLPGRASHRVWLMVFREDVVLASPALQIVGRGYGPDRWRAEGLELDCVTPYKRWTLRYTGRVAELRPPGSGQRDAETMRCSVDLTFLAEAPPFSPGADDDPELIARHFGAATWDASLLRSVRRVQNRGYVQLGSMVGSVALGAELLPVRASCLRQHTWGVRDWGASDEAFQCFAAFDDGRRAWVHHAAFPFVTLQGGLVYDTKQQRPIRSMGATLERRPGRVPRNVTLSLELPSEARGGSIAESPQSKVEVNAEMLSDLAMTVDGRGSVRLGFFRLADGSGWGFWGGQRRLLPRRGAGR